VRRWETEWPVLHSVPMETTSKGAHYYFRHTTLCNELGLTNGLLNKQADFSLSLVQALQVLPPIHSAKVWNIQYKIWKADLLYLRSVH